MASEIPNVSEIHGNILSDIKSNLPDSNPFLENGMLNILGWGLAGTQSGNYQYVTNEALQKYATTATGQALEEIGATYGIARKLATKSTGFVFVTGQLGSTIPIGTKIASSTGSEYIVLAEATITGGSDKAEIESVKAGTDKNISAGATMTFSGTPPGVDQTVTVDADGLGGGTDDQTDDEYRGSILSNIQNPARGGASADYDWWCKDALSSVTRVWAFGKDDESTIAEGAVDVFFMMDKTYDDGIPQGADVTIVDDYLKSNNVKPVTAVINTQSPTLVKELFVMDITPDETDVKTDVDDSLKGFMSSFSDVSGILYLSKINEFISIADGEFDHTLKYPTANVQNLYGYISGFGKTFYNVNTVNADITFSAINPNTTDFKNRVTYALNNYVKENTDEDKTIFVSEFDTVVAGVSGYVSHTITSGNVTSAVGEVIIPSIITYP